MLLRWAPTELKSYRDRKTLFWSRCVLSQVSASISYDPRHTALSTGDFFLPLHRYHFDFFSSFASLYLCSHKLTFNSVALLYNVSRYEAVLVFLHRFQDQHYSAGQQC